MSNKIKIVFILIPIVVLGFTGVLPANIAWAGGALIILNCLFNRPIPMKPLDYFKNITPEEILKGKDISDPTRQKLLGETPLHSAVKYNDNPEVIKALITTGADIHAQANDGSTPLHDAAKHNMNAKVIKALLDTGAEVNALDVLGNTPLHSAAESNENPEIIQVLLDFGADINKQNYSWVQKKLEMLYRRNPREYNKIGNTPLHNAARWNENPEITMALINAGADGKIQNYADKNPFELIQNDNSDISIDYDYFKTPKNETLKDTDSYQALKDASE